jgi:tyrocidine synthetase-3
VGGDVVSPKHINKVRKDNSRLKVINCYGPTENTTFSTTYLIEKDFEHNIPIGKPVSNSTSYIFDTHLNYQPIGVIGELYVGGDGLSRGYLNRDDLNRISFVEHPLIPGERLYKTGDRARWLSDGNIEFHGRIDNQIKVRGFRVELEEIESAISEIEGVNETIVKPFKIEEGDIRLVAFLNVSDNFNKETKEIIRCIKEKLPPYMVPSAYKIMHGFPKTTSGKIERKELHLNINDLENRESQDIGTLTQTERKILNIWCDILKTKKISITDNFFDIGGNSLLAISVFSKIKSAFNIEFGLRVFFESPRIKDLAEAIDIALQRSIEQKPVDKKDEIDSNIVKGEI